MHELPNLSQSALQSELAYRVTLLTGQRTVRASERRYRRGRGR